jgi:Protein of unknown function (DUF3313)
MERRQFMSLTLGCGTLALAGPAAAADAPESWDGLVRVKGKKFQLVYLQPGADFRGYTKVMVDPTEVAFRKNWARDYNTSIRGASGRVSDADVEKTTQQGAAAATDIFADAFTKAGYTIVKDAGPDVLRVRTLLLNIHVRAPDIPTAGRTRSYASEAGEATLVVEVRDSETGAMIGRAVDRRLAGDNSILSRNQVSNRADFRTLVQSWAGESARGLAELKTLSPVSAAGGG